MEVDSSHIKKKKTPFTHIKQLLAHNHLYAILTGCNVIKAMNSLPFHTGT